MTKTFAFLSAIVIPAARLTEVVVLPVPPFILAIEITRATMVALRSLD